MMKLKDSWPKKDTMCNSEPRPLKRAIQTHLEDGLSELIITSSLKEKDVIQVSLNKEKGELEMKVIAS